MSSASDAQQLTRVAEMPIAAQREGAPAAAEAEGGLTLADFWRIIKQRKLLILVGSFVLYALIGLITLVVWRWFPAYSGTAYLQLRPPIEDAFKISDPLVQPQIMEMLLKTEAQKINRLDVLQDVLKQPEIKNTRFYAWYDDFDKCLYDLQKILYVHPVPDTHLIGVSLAIRDPDEAVLIVKTVVERYLEQYKRAAGERGRESVEGMKTTRVTVEQELKDKQRELSEFRARTDVGALESETEMLVRSLADQKYVVNSYDVRAADLQAQLDSIEGIDPRSLPITPEDRVIVEADPILRLYRQQVESMDVEIATAQAYLTGPNHRAMKLLQGRRDGYYGKEVARREELLDDLRERKVDMLRQELARVRAVQARAQDQMEQMQSRMDDLDAARVRYEALVKDEERLQKTLEEIDKAVAAFQHVAAAEPRDPRLVPVQWPRRAVEPSRPNLKLWLTGGVPLALVGAIGLAFLRELTDKAIRTPIDVARYGRLSVLGCIPQLDDEQVEIEGIELATRQAPQSLVAEAFRQVRANLVFSGPAESQRVLLVTSPGPGAGKTATTINLAVTLTQGNQRVLLVDANFRRPAIRGAFPGTRPEGLSNVLVGQAKLADVITRANIPNLDVLTSGPMPPNPAELLGSTYMKEMIEQAKARYDRVLFDGPPILLISDGLVLATQVDGVIVVARAVENTKGALRRARDQLEKINAHVVGAILNGVRPQAGGYFRQQYREFYDYSSDETVPRELPGLAAPTPKEPGSRSDDSAT